MNVPDPTAHSPHRVVATREGYDLWADLYDVEDNPLIALEEPRVISLLGPVRGLRIADVGCGTGRHALRLAAEGAIVTALDFSQGMLDKARRRDSPGSISFVIHDLARPLPLLDSSMDRVICCLVIEHIADLGLLFAELKRICRPDGFIIVSAMHPAMMLRGISARFVDATGQEIRPQSHAHRISDFVMAALRAGLFLDHLSEHAVDQALAARSPRAAKYLNWPMLLMMRLRPPPAAR